jgi:hypothetical protein
VGYAKISARRSTTSGNAGGATVAPPPTARVTSRYAFAAGARWISTASATAAEDREVGLRLGVVGEGDGALDPHDGAPRQAHDQELGEVVDERAVAAALGRFLDDLAPDQLDPVALGEDAHLGHPVVLLAREQPPRHAQLHRHLPPPALADLIEQHVAGRRAH